MDSHGSSGLPFDAAAYLKTPSVIVRLVSLLFAIIVFGCIADGVDSGSALFSGYCSYDDENACNYGIAIGVIAFIACIAFLVLDGLVMNRDDGLKKSVIYADLMFSALWTLMWFIGFCYLTDRWRTVGSARTSHVKNNAQAAIAFSFFSIASWAFLAVFAFKRVREYNAGASGYNAQVDDTSGGGGGGDPGYSSFPAQADLSESYQKPPFSSEGEKADYQPPAY